MNIRAAALTAAIVLSACQIEPVDNPQPPPEPASAADTRGDQLCASYESVHKTLPGLEEVCHGKRP